MDIKHNLSLVVALAIPVLMIVLVAGAIYLPRLWAPAPQYDFLYAVGSYPAYVVPEESKYIEHTYVVSGGRLTRQSRELAQNTLGLAYPLWRSDERQEPRFYVHDAATNTSRELTDDEAGALHLEAEKESPDGFELVRGSASGGFPFFDDGGDYDTYYLRGHSVSRELNVKTGSSTFADGFTFIGWVIE